MIKEPVRPEPGRPSGPGARVLIVDDDVATATALRDLFTDSPFVAEVAASAEEAIERFRGETFAVVLADHEERHGHGGGEVRVDRAERTQVAKQLVVQGLPPSAAGPPAGGPVTGSSVSDAV